MKHVLCGLFLIWPFVASAQYWETEPGPFDDGSFIWDVRMIPDPGNGELRMSPGDTVAFEYTVTNKGDVVAGLLNGEVLPALQADFGTTNQLDFVMASDPTDDHCVTPVPPLNPAANSETPEFPSISVHAFDYLGGGEFSFECTLEPHETWVFARVVLQATSNISFARIDLGVSPTSAYWFGRTFTMTADACSLEREASNGSTELAPVVDFWSEEDGGVWDPLIEGTTLEVAVLSGGTRIFRSALEFDISWISPDDVIAWADLESDRVSGGGSSGLSIFAYPGTGSADLGSLADANRIRQVGGHKEMDAGSPAKLGRNLACYIENLRDDGETHLGLLLTITNDRYLTTSNSRSYTSSRHFQIQPSLTLDTEGTLIIPPTAVPGLGSAGLLALGTILAGGLAWAAGYSRPVRRATRQ